MSKIFENTSLFIFFLIIGCVLTIDAVSLQNIFSHRLGNRNVLKVDMTTDYAKHILRLSKAAEINSNINLKIDPCDDFYQYSCGNWQHGNPALFPDKMRTDRIQEISKAFDRRLFSLINESEDDNEVRNKVKTFYSACKIAREDELQYKFYLQNILKEFGNWDGLVDENWNATDFKWWETVAKIQHKYGKQILLSTAIMADLKNKSESRIYLGPPYDVAEVPQVSEDLEAQLIAELVSQFDIDRKLAKKTAKELRAFEDAVSQGGTDSRLSQVLQEMLQLQNVKTLAQTYEENFDIKRYLEIVLGQNSTESIYIYDEGNLVRALKIIESTPKHIVANYILRQLLKNFYVESNVQMDSWCVDKTKLFFRKYVDNWVYSLYRDEKEETAVTQVFEDIRATFREAMRGNKLDWISNNTREYAIVKLDATKLIFNTYENENFTNQYENLKLDPYNYIENVRRVLMKDSINALNKLNESNISAPEDAVIMSITPTYHMLENNIKIPVAFLQPWQFWSAEYPIAIKYATLGYLIAHEIIHGFDDESRMFGRDGNPYTWWDPRSKYEFEERRKCFEAQYHSFKYKGKALPENVPQLENIADNAGIKLAYKAYQRWLNEEEKKNPEIETKEVLPNISLSNRQLFFVSFAQIWCEDILSTVAVDEHASGMYRVIGSLSNFQEFSWIFNCSQDARMDPKYKCSIY